MQSKYCVSCHRQLSPAPAFAGVTEIRVEWLDNGATCFSQKTRHPGAGRGGAGATSLYITLASMLS